MGKLLLAVVGILFMLTPVKAKAVEADRLLYIDQPITRLISPLREGIMAMSDASKKPITIVINSPGGSVVSGMGFINDMRYVRSRGIELNCYVLDMAASMAFQILTECTNRYALRSSYLLWHGVRVQIQDVITANYASTLHNELSRMDKEVLRQLDSTLHLSYDDIREHFNAETLWSGSELAEADPRFIHVATAYPEVVSKLGDAVHMAKPAFGFLFGGSNEDDTYVYIWRRFDHLLFNK